MTALKLFVPKLLPLALALLTGCARYSMEQVRNDFRAGRHDAALSYLDEKGPKTPQLPNLFERGLIAHYANHLQESNQAFELAELISDDLYTRSLSREAFSLVTSDNVRPYAGTRYERFLTHYYRALNYLYLNLPDEALVECRRASRLLQQYADEDLSFQYTGAAFLAYLSGILYEMQGDWNDAFISYRQAEKGYVQYAALGVQMPPDVGHALVRLARRLGFADEAQIYLSTYGEPPKRPEGFGELVLIYESGFVPPKQEANIFLPIFKTDKLVRDDEDEDNNNDTEKRRRRTRRKLYNDDETWNFAQTLVARRDLRYEEVNLEYLLRVAIPEYRSNRPRFAGVEVWTDKFRKEGALVEDVETAAMTTFAAEQGKILLRTVVRGLLKYLGFRQADKESEIAGFLINALNVATERADTRSWETLPNQIFLARMYLPAGTHAVNLTFLDHTGRKVGTQTLPDIKIAPNRITLSNYRTFE